MNKFKKNSENVNILNVQYSATACTTNSFMCHLDTVFGDSSNQGIVSFLFTRFEPMWFLLVVYIKQVCSNNPCTEDDIKKLLRR